ncbi:hypothetical protein GOBAR_AA14731 [Gossypium barbadense]|uniref:WAT1-related protein n=1 Tax=Gossypium barbadense TaxID=3634 RepID=A0A2P5XRC8_GOSBA|nr:hypothetical protein GOBAR_AA14731 [Gossypium barbadense]
MARRYCYNDVLPLTAMVAIECTNVGLNVLFKKATSKGMSYFIFITYTYAIGALLLLSLSFPFPSRQVLPSLNFHLGFRIFLFGLIGFFAQVCAYKRIDYSNPTLASTISNLSPAFTFILAVLFRRISSCSLQRPPSFFLSITVFYFTSTFIFKLGHWGILLAVAYLLFSIRYIIQTHVMEIYPAELLVALFYNICGAIISAPVSLIAESELSSWMLRPSVAVIAVLCSGVIQGFSSFVIAWGLHLKGPVYIAIFKPVSIAIAAFMSAIFLGDSLYLGSIIGVIIISIGFYAVIWEKAKEAERTTSSSKVPLLKVEDARISKRNARILKRK